MKFLFARISRVAFVVALVSLMTGCGYTVGSTLDPKYQTIYVAAFKNNSSEYDLQAPLTNAITRKFINDGRLRVVPHDQADLLLEGTVLDYTLKGLTFDAKDDVTQYLALVTAGVRLTDSRTSEVLWEDPLMTGETSFYTRALAASSDRLRGNAEVFVTPVRSFQTKEENQAAAEALEQLASDIFFRTVEPW